MEPGSRNRFELLFENAPVAIWLEDFSHVYSWLQSLNTGSESLADVLVANPEAVRDCLRRVRILHVNRLAREFYGATTVEQLTEGFAELFDAQSLATFCDEVIAFWSGETSFEAEITTTTLLGEPRLVKMNCALLPDTETPWSFLIVTFTDLTERQHFEHTLRASEQRAQQYAAGLKQSNELLARLNTDLERFAYAAAHDLREPLRTVSLYTQLLRHSYGSFLTGHAEVAINFILDGTHRMEQLISDLLQFARAIDRPTTTTETLFSESPEVLDEVLRSLEAAIRESNAQLTVDPIPPIAIQPAQLRQLLQNLIGNAIKYRSPERELHIRITSTAQDGRVIVCIIDNGEGIRSQYQDRIFGIFQRLHGREVQGSGIGLALCRRIVDLYGGRIWVESDGVSGSTFCFELPAASEPPIVNQPSSPSVDE